MTFAHLNMLYLIWALPFLVLLFVHASRRRKRILATFARNGAPSAGAAKAPGRRRAIRAGLFLACLACLVPALAGPRLGYDWEKVERRGVSLMIALDLSKSMLTRDIKPDRLTRAKREVTDLLARLGGDKAGLVVFAGTAWLQCPLTLDYAAFDLFLEAAKPDLMPVGGTNLAAALETSLSAFDPKDGSEKAIILITDGESTTGSDPIAAAEKAAEHQVRVFCIGMGGPAGAPVPEPGGGFKKDASGNIVHSRLDEATLQKIADLTGGASVRSVTGDMDLDRIYDTEIKGKMEDRLLQEDRVKVFKDRYRWFLGAALFFLALEMLLPAVRMGATLLVLAVLLLPARPAFAAGAAGSAGEIPTAYKAGDYQTVLKRCLDAQVHDPDAPEAAYGAGAALYKLKRFEEAAEAFTLAGEQAKAAERTELRQKAAYNLGDAMYRLNNLQGAVKAFEEAAALDPADADAAKNLAFVKKQLQQQQQQNRNKDKEGEDKKEGENGGRPQEDDRSGKNAPQQARPDEKQGGQDEQRPRPEPEQKDGREEKKPAPQQQDKGGLDQSMLNRIKDQPGRPAPAEYRKRRVQKDW